MSLVKLNNIQDNTGARKPKVRVGRGIGSGVGKTSGRGVKGAKARSGNSVNGFEGGQMPLYRRLPKFGFKNPNRKEYSEVTTGRLQRAVENGKLEADKLITTGAILAAGLVKKKRDGIRLLNKGSLSVKVDIEVSGVSAGARTAIESAGGSIALVGRVATSKSEE